MIRDELARSNRRRLWRVLLTLGALDLMVIVIVLVVSLWGVAVGLSRVQVASLLVAGLAGIVAGRIVFGIRLKAEG